MNRSQSLGAFALALAGVLFLLFPFVRPWGDETTAAGAAAVMGLDAWVIAHAFHMLGFMLVGLGLLGLRDVVGGALAHAAVVATWVGAGLVLPFVGAEGFGVHALAAQYAGGARLDLLAAVSALRFTPVAITMFAVGILTLVAGAILAAVAVWRSGVLPRWSGVLFAVGFALFPVATSPAVRMAHGVLLAAGCAWLAIALWRARPVSAAA